MTKLAIIFLSLSLTGCATKLLENVAVCSLDKGDAYVVSRYGTLGIATKLSDGSAAVMCK